MTGILVMTSQVCDEYGLDLNITFRIFKQDEEVEARKWLEENKVGYARTYIDTNFDIFSEVEPSYLLD